MFPETYSGAWKITSFEYILNNYNIHFDKTTYPIYLNRITTRINYFTKYPENEEFQLKYY